MSSIKILVVEDEAIVAEDIASRLEMMGYTVIDIVATGEAAIEQAIESDLVLMDVMLQGKMDGIEAAEQIQIQRKVPIVYLTAYADESRLQRAKVDTSFGYLLKPFKEKELRATIEVAWARYQAEQQMQQALELSESLRQQAQDLNLLQSQFISMVSHEFRTPLTVIKMACEMLQHYHSQLSPEKKQQHFQRISGAIDSMNQLLEDVLTLGQTEAGRGAYNPQLLEVVSFCQEVVDGFQEAAVNYGVVLVDQIAPMQIALDEKLLQQLLNNLLSNAIKYSTEGTTITLRLFQQAESLGLEVQDQGIGIAPQDLKYVFEPFQRGSNVGKIPGTGLGLAIVKRAVDLHQGEISVTSAIGQGTTFTIMLPLERNST